jgi:hypothetical protein
VTPSIILMAIKVRIELNLYSFLGYLRSNGKDSCGYLRLFLRRVISRTCFIGFDFITAHNRQLLITGLGVWNQFGSSRVFFIVNWVCFDMIFKNYLLYLHWNCLIKL